MSEETPTGESGLSVWAACGSLGGHGHQDRSLAPSRPGRGGHTFPSLGRGSAKCWKGEGGLLPQALVPAAVKGAHTIWAQWDYGNNVVSSAQRELS